MHTAILGHSPVKHQDGALSSELIAKVGEGIVDRAGEDHPIAVLDSKATLRDNSLRGDLPSSSNQPANAAGTSSRIRRRLRRTERIRGHEFAVSGGVPEGRRRKDDLLIIGSQDR